MTEQECIKEVLGELKEHPKVQQMKQYIQHGTTSTYEHCEKVVEVCFYINERLHLRADLKVLLTGAMLHDFYLYDWHNEDDGSHKWHGYTHAEQAMNNAIIYFQIEEPVQTIIWSHMWPLNLTRVPKTKEAWILCMADKYVSFWETVNRRKKNVD